MFFLITNFIAVRPSTTKHFGRVPLIVAALSCVKGAHTSTEDHHLALMRRAQEGPRIVQEKQVEEVEPQDHAEAIASHLDLSVQRKSNSQTTAPDTSAARDACFNSINANQANFMGSKIQTSECSAYLAALGMQPFATLISSSSQCPSITSPSFSIGSKSFYLRQSSFNAFWIVFIIPVIQKVCALQLVESGVLSALKFRPIYCTLQDAAGGGAFQVWPTDCGSVPLGATPTVVTALSTAIAKLPANTSRHSIDQIHAMAAQYKE